MAGLRSPPSEYPVARVYGRMGVRGWAGGAHTIRHSPTQRFEADGVPAAISPTQGKAPGRDRALDLYAPVLPALCSMKLFLHKKLRA